MMDLTIILLVAAQTLKLTGEPEDLLIRTVRQDTASSFCFILHIPSWLASEAIQDK